MNGNIYELAALGARYVFAAVMLLIVVRAWRITIVDSRRAARLRRYSPETGVCGEFLVIKGDGRSKDGMRYPVIREGMIGSSRKADVRLRTSSVRRAHAYFELTPRGLHVRTHANSKLYNGRGESRGELYLGDGSRISIGRVELMLVLAESAGVNVQTESDTADTIFDVPAERPAQPTISDEKRPSAVPWDVDAPPQPDPDALFDVPAPEPAPTARPEPQPTQPTQYAPPQSGWARPAPDIPLWDDDMSETPRPVEKARQRHTDDPFDI